ncbi:MAG TPA: glycosyltransferase family 4 protein [Thermoanaerobaculia bacterium]|nr:glycosyltransferase family 4 protein [Thermoanaerobaculia bacterium]
MKIAYIEPAGKGGMIHYAFQLCRGLASRGADVTLLTDQHYELELLPAPFRVEPIMRLWDARPAGSISKRWWASAARRVRRGWRAVRYYRQWLRVVRRVSALRPDIVLLGDIRFPFDLFALMILRRRARFMADICHNVHPFAASGGKGGGLFDRSARTLAFYRRIYHLFDAVFVHFERNRREFTETFGLPEERVAVIVHGNEAIFGELRRSGTSAQTIRKRLEIGPDEKVVLFFGLLSRYKGTDVLLEAFPRVHRETGARLVLAGFPSPEFDLAAQQQSTRVSGIEQAVRWVPEYIPTDEVAAWMEMASVAVFPYRDIYQSGALHVPHTFGVPIVATAIRAMQDVIDDEASGLLVPPGDPGALAGAIIRILTDDALARRLGRRAAEDAQSKFAWETIAGIILDHAAALMRRHTRNLR